METNISNYKINYKSENITLSSINDDKNYTVIKIDIKFTEKTKPEPTELRWTTPGNGAYICWDTEIVQDRFLRPNWSKLKTESRSACGIPIQCYIDSNSNNCTSVYLSDSNTPVAIRSGIIEETGEIEWKLILFSQMTESMDNYSAVLVIDRRKIPHSDVVEAARLLWTDNMGELPQKPASAYDLVYSTWYSYHQQITDKLLIPELESASKLGMKTVIIDDGWQTDDNNRGYGFCGDWKISPSKIPDMKAFTDRVHKMGMKVMLWFSVPFIGEYLQIKDRFEGKYLYHIKSMHTYVLDPRFPEVRDYLCTLYEASVRDWGLDGLKLDFIDSFRLTDESKSYNKDMDTESLELAVCRLLQETYERLTAIKPDILIEFRQNYVGPIMQRYGNMLRAADCPMDSVTNRVRTLNLRLTSGETAIHSDMLMWNYDDAPETAAEQLLNVFFSVPQISMRINELSESHYNMLKFYLDLWSKNQQTLIHGKLTAKKPEANYSMAYAEYEDEIIAVMYSEKVLNVDEKYNKITIINSTGDNKLYIDGDTKDEYTYIIYDCTGELSEKGKTNITNVCKFNIPKSGVIILTFA